MWVVDCYGQCETQRDCPELLIVCVRFDFWSWLACTSGFREAIYQFLGISLPCSFDPGEAT